MKNFIHAQQEATVAKNCQEDFNRVENNRPSTIFMRVSAAIVASVLFTCSVSCSPKHETTVDSANEAKVPQDSLGENAGKSSADKSNSDSPVASLTIGSKAPPIDIAQWISFGNGKFKPIKDFEAGKVYVVEFWATWCGPCVASMPHLAKTQMEYIDKNVQIISISDEKMETITEFLDREIAEAKKSKKEVASDEEDADESAAKRPKETYRELTGAYCLTTDPDRSVSKDYMKAAGQNGIPTCFIVGKSGEIEWIGHPMGMDKPLAKVVEGSWDRAAYLVEYKKSKDRELMMSAIMQKMRKGDSEGALKQISEAKKAVEGDAKSLAMLDQMMLNVIVTPAMKKVRAGDIEGGLEMLNELSESLTTDQQALLGSVKFRLNMQANRVEAAEESLKKMIDTENVDPQTLNAAAWDIYQAAKEDREFSKPLLAAAMAAAEKAVTKAPNNGAILDTLAHLFHLQGDLERAIELQTKAMQNAGTAETEIQAYLDQLKAEKAEK